MGAKIFDAQSKQEALEYIIELCQNKAPCEFLSKDRPHEEKTKKSSESPNSQLTQTERFVAHARMFALFTDWLAGIGWGIFILVLLGLS